MGWARAQPQEGAGPAHGPRAFCGWARARARAQLWSYGPCPMAYVLWPVSYAHVLCPMSYVLWPMAYVLCPMSYVLCPVAYGLCPMAYGQCPMALICWIG